jgi:hypothetical protein
MCAQQRLDMRDDLLHAQASVDWPVSQFPSFNTRINIWLQFNLEVVVKDPDPDIPYNLVVVIQKEPLPLAFHVEAGAYLNAIRSGLDILASALYSRNRISENAEAHFPIFRSWVDFIDPVEGLEGKKWLSSAEREIIKTLNPYQKRTSVVPSSIRHHAQASPTAACGAEPRIL